MKHIVDTTEVESGWMVLKGHDPNRRMVKATLVIGEERVFTESEVKAMLADIGHHSIVFITTGEFHRHIISTAERHGVLFDPA